MRAGGVAFAVLEIGVFTKDFPPGYERAAWIATGVFAVGTLLLGLAILRAPDEWLRASASSRRPSTPRSSRRSPILFSFEYGSPTRWALIIVVVEAALRWGVVGGIVAAARADPVPLVRRALARHALRAARVPRRPRVVPGRDPADHGLIVGWLVARLRDAAAAAGERAAEAEELRDQLGRRVDVLDAASRCARALSSSLELDQAFGAFIRELAGLLAVRPGRDRPRRVGQRAGDGHRRQGRRRRLPAGLAAADRGLDPRGRAARRAADLPARTSTEPRYPEERELAALGLRSRVAAPLLAGSRAIGMLSLVRREPDAFDPEEVELVGLLGRFVARRRPEHPRLRGRAPHRRGAAAALGAARGLRLARLARAPQPDGGGDRRGADAPGAVAGARPRAARGVPRPDRARRRPGSRR